MVSRPFSVLFGTAACFALVACGGGSSSGSSSGLGGSQDPDPVVVDFPIAFVKRPLVLDANGDLITSAVRDAVQFRPGAELLLRDRASSSAAETNLTEGIFPDDVDGNPPLYDVKDLSVSYDGLRMAFAMRAPEDPNLDDDEQAKWNLWVYDRAFGTVNRVISSDITAEDGEDVAPKFLPDGRIVFSSTRQRQSKAILLDEGKPQFSALDENRIEESLTLHVIEADGSNLHQISFNQSSDLDPAVMSDGRILFSRWDNVSVRDRISLYQANPDGTDQQLLYGVHSHDTGPNGQNIEFVEASELPDGRLLVMLRPSGDQIRMGAFPVAIDTPAYVEHDQPTFPNQGLLGDAQEVLIPGDLNLDDDTPALQGRFASISPLYDGTNRFLVAWSQCRLVDEITDPLNPIIAPCMEPELSDPNFVEADPLYGIWMRDVDADTQQPIVTPVEGELYSEVVVMEDRNAPPVILDKVAGIDFDPDLVSEAAGIVNVRTVYDFDGVSVVPLDAFSDPLQTTGADRPARFARFVKAVSIPDDDIVDLEASDFGVSQAQGMREILGYARIEPDGSLISKVPANVAFWIDVLDANGRRITGRHNNWMQLRPGEEMACNGCHTGASEVAHGRMPAEAPSANAGATVDGLPFPNTEPALFANAGETMAEVYARINGYPDPNVDVVYDDVWTDPNVRAKDLSFMFEYAALTTPAPVDPGCVGTWVASCRITINYEMHIHPLWGVDRGVDTCTACHSLVDAMGNAIVPAMQLDLSDGQSDIDADHYKSYRELLTDDNAQVLDANGNVIDDLIQATDANGNLLFLTDANGNFILDQNGQLIPILVPVNSGAPLSVAGANAAGSQPFFSRFATGATHDGRLTDAELKLVSEWIDIGGQYYNNPFDVPP